MMPRPSRSSITQKGDQNHGNDAEAISSVRAQRLIAMTVAKIDFRNG
jgi:hypothetical protein